MSRANFPKLLIVAPNASSKFGGEAFLPLKYFQILKQRGREVRLITHARNKTDLEAVVGDFMSDVLFVPDTIYHRGIWKIGRRFPRQIRDSLFGNLLNLTNEVFQARLIRDLVRQGKVELIHQPIPVSPLAPSTIYGFGVPVIIGPMNGGMAYPEGYEDIEGRATGLFVSVSRMFAKALNRVIPGKKRAAALLVANARTRRALPFQNHPNVIELVENGVDLSTWKRPEQARREEGVFRLVFMGRLIDLKAVDITLEAVRLAMEQGVNVVFDILGDGPERPRLEKIAADMGLSDTVRFHGFKPQSECAALLGGADALILNSVRECGGAVVLEAMSLGVPVIGADWGGPADYIDENCGFLIAPVPRKTFAARLSEAILALANTPGLKEKMGQAGARKITEQFDWEKKVDQMEEIYRETLARVESPQ